MSVLSALLADASDAELAELAAALAPHLPDLPAPACEPYMSVEDAANYYSCKPKRIYDLCSQERIPYLKDGSRTLLRRADLDASLTPAGADTPLAPPPRSPHRRVRRGDR